MRIEQKRRVALDRAFECLPQNERRRAEGLYKIVLDLLNLNKPDEISQETIEYIARRMIEMACNRKFRLEKRGDYKVHFLCRGEAPEIEPIFIFEKKKPPIFPHQWEHGPPLEY